MTEIRVPISVPGATESSQELLKAAAAVQKLAQEMEREKAIQTSAAAVRRNAAAAAREQAAAASAAADAARRANAEFIREQAALARNINAQTPGWMGGGGAPGAPGNRRGFITGDRVGAIASVAGQAVPGLGPTAGALMTGGAWGGPFAALIASVGVVSWAFNKAAERAQEAAQGFAAVSSVNARLSKAQDAADSAGLSVYDRTRRSATLTAARGGDAAIGRAQAIAAEQGISIDDALSLTAAGLDGNQAKAAVLASKTLGIGIGDAAEKIRRGRWRGTPAQIAAGISGGQANASEITSRAARIAGSDYGLYGAAIDQESSNASLDEFALIPRALQGARNRGRDFRRQADVSGTVREELTDEYRTREGSTADSDEKRKINAERERVFSEIPAGKKTINAAAR